MSKKICILALSLLFVSSLAFAEIIQEWYTNEEFAFKMLKLPGWKFREDVEDIMITLGFQDSFQNTLIINVTRLPKGADYFKGGDFISYNDAVIDSATGKLNNLRFIKKPNTILINDVQVREAVFEWEDEKHNNEKFTNILMFFYPVETNSNIITVFVLFKCKSVEYPYIQPHLEKSLTSIEISN